MAEATFSPMAPVGHSFNAAIGGIEAGQSMMERASRIRQQEQMEQMNQMKLAQEAMLMPLKQAETQADLTKAKTNYEGALQTQALRKQAYGLLDKARQDFDFLNLITDDQARAQASREWLSRYSQLENIAELKDEVKSKNNLATQNIIGAMKINLLGGTEMRTFNSLTEGFTPEEKAQAQRVKTGIQARPSSAAIQYREVQQPDGSKILVAVDPRQVGTQIIGTGETYGSGVSPTRESEARAAGQPVPQGNSYRGQSTEAEARDKKEAELQVTLEKERPKRQKALQQAEVLSNRLSDDIDELITKVNAATAGPGGVILDKFPGTTARDLQAQLDSIKSNIGFQTLQAMREASPTGGALGNVSDVENKLLQSVLGSLEIGQSPAQLIANLRKVKNRTIENYGITRAAFVNQYGDQKEASSALSDMSTEALEARLRELRGTK